MFIYCIQGNTYEIYTPNSGRYTTAWLYPVNEYFEFDAAACNDLHIAMTLTPYNLTDNAYAIVIGGHGNSRQWIREKVPVSIRVMITKISVTN